MSSTSRPMVFPGILAGIGLAGTLDEVILHQLLHWHHLYDRASDDAGLVSDGLFHLASTALLVTGVALAMARAWQVPGEAGRERMTALIGATLLGAGGFNLFDGIVNHKILRIHQVRPDASNWLPYDIAFNLIALVLLVAGLWLLRVRSQAPPQPTRSH